MRSPNSSPLMNGAKKPKLQLFCNVFPGQEPTTTLDSKEKVWAQGYDVFLRAIQSKPLLDGEPVLMLTPFSPMIDAKQEFWMRFFDEFPQHIQTACTMSSKIPEEKLVEMLKLYHSGLVFLLLHNPSQIRWVHKHTDNALQSTIESDEFWNFNPILLVSVILWMRAAHARAFEILRDNPTCTVDQLGEMFQFVLPPTVTEKDVCEQDLALDFLETQSQTGEQMFLDFLSVVTGSFLLDSEPFTNPS